MGGSKPHIGGRISGWVHTTSKDGPRGIGQVIIITHKLHDVTFLKLFANSSHSLPTLFPHLVHCWVREVVELEDRREGIHHSEVISNVGEPGLRGMEGCMAA